MIKTAMKQSMKGIFNKFGFDIIRKSPLTEFGMDDVLQRCQSRGIEIQTVIDVGASNGCWSDLCMKYFPKAFYYLIEAQKVHEPALREKKAIHSNLDYILAAAGNGTGEIYFDNEDAFGGVAVEKKFDGHCISVPLTNIDAEVKKHNLQGPYLIKFDTHGFEVPILEGASTTLKNTNIVIMEVYNFKLTENSLRFFEMCSYMEKLGFAPIDIADFSRRLYDDSFWQMDIVFIRKDRKEFSYTEYR